MAEDRQTHQYWSEDLYTVKDLIGNFNFPVIAQVQGGLYLYGNDDSCTFSNGELIKFHDARTVNVLEASIIVPNYESTPVFVPLGYKHKLKVLTQKDPSYVYHTVGGLVQDFPHTVIVGAPFSVGHRVVHTGDFLQLCSIDRRCTKTGVKEFLTCKHNERDIALGMEVVGDFRVFPDERKHTITEFITNYRLPQKVCFLGTREDFLPTLSQNLLDLVSLLPEFNGEFILQKESTHQVIVASTLLEPLGHSFDEDDHNTGCHIVAIPVSENPFPIHFSVAIKPTSDSLNSYFLSDLNTEDMVDNLIEFANKPSIISFGQISEYLEPLPPVLPRKPTTSSDEDEYDYVDGSYLIQTGVGSSSEDLTPRTTHPRKGSYPQSSSSLEEVGKTTSTPEFPPALKHKKKFLQDAKSMFSQSLDNLADKLHKKKSKSPEQPRIQISAPISQGRPQRIFPDPSDDNYENIYHSMQTRRPLGVRKGKGEPKVGIAHPQSYGTMIGTELNTDLRSPSEEGDNAMNIGAAALNTGAHIDAYSYRSAQPNTYVSPRGLRIGIEQRPQDEPLSPTRGPKPPIAPKPRMGTKHATEVSYRRTSSDANEILNRRKSSDSSDQKTGRLSGEITNSYSNSHRNGFFENNSSNTMSYEDNTARYSTDSSYETVDPFYDHSVVSAEPPRSITSNMSCLKINAPSTSRGNRPISNTDTSSQPMRAIVTIDDIPEDLSALNVEDISSVMRVCGMGKIADIFQTEVLDGSMFMELSEDMLREHFNLSAFEILKVMKIQKGYRPKL